MTVFTMPFDTGPGGREALVDPDTNFGTVPPTQESALNTAVTPEDLTPTELERFMSTLQVAVLLPCHNEALSIARVVASFKAALPNARIFVYDNRSTDDTSAVARAAGAIVRYEPWPGKGNVVRRMFADIEADVYLMADGDGTYDPSVAVTMVRRLVSDHLDMVVGTRRNVYQNAHRKGHGFGNKMFNGFYRRLFGPLFTDIFSGYRAFSRRFVKSFPAISSGFEIETEMSVQASQMRMPIAEIQTDYGKREEGSSSKLNTYRDALRILRTQVLLFKEIRPARFFGGIAIALTFLAIFLAWPIVVRFIEWHDVPRFPTAILATGLVLLAAISFLAGLILDSVAAGRLEQKRLAYLRMPQLKRPLP